MKNNPDMLNTQGVTFMKMGRPEDAISCFRKAIALRPGYLNALANLSIGLQRQGKFDESIFCCRQALKIQPNNPFV